MELLLNQELDSEPEPINISCNTTEGLLQSNYKMIVNRNFKSSSSASLFGKRQGLKATQFNTVNHASVIIRVAVFVTALVTIF